MSASNFQIYNASAGSGKTYSLAKNYLKLVLSSQNNQEFKSLLAITFTNKAVGEMKDRIIRMLKQFSVCKDDAYVPMLDEISNELEMPKAEIKKRSNIILKTILHNYGAFEISTIDGFTHRIIRTFAHDLRLSTNFEVELDQEQMLFEAVDSLIENAGSDKELTDVLIDFAVEKTNDNKSWDISYDFYDISKLLINENDIAEMNKLKLKTLNDFRTFKHNTFLSIQELKSDIKEESESILDLIESAGLEYSDFSSKYLPTHFVKLKNGQTDVNFETGWQLKLLDGAPLYPGRVSDFIASTIDELQPIISEAFINTKTKVFKLRFLNALYTHITPVSVLNAIQNELNSIKEEENKMLISEFNTIISNQVKDQPTPFIYERLGEKFKHYFIDEFQDTSMLQWQNLIPLLDNALSSDGSTMLVGDAKQSIYRWRGGDPEQFMSLYDLQESPFQIEAKILNLDTNYRSSKTIVDFNNAFFTFIGKRFFTNANYTALYQNAYQKSNNENEGFISLNFIESDNENYQETTCINVLNTVNDCLESGYSLSDICVITRKRKEGVMIAEYLTENDIRITSAETLLLVNSSEVNFLNQFLKALTQPENNVVKIEILSFLADYHQIENKHEFFNLYLNENLDDFFSNLSKLGYHINREVLSQISLYEIVEQLIRTFRFNNTSNAFLTFYLDLVLEYSQKQNSDINAFLTFFEKKQDNLSVVSPNDLDAVQIMTIHKCKGLEFPVVIYPFADLEIYRELRPKAWIPLDPNSFSGFENVLVNYNKELKNFGEDYSRIYDERQSQLQLDSINLLYVVMTRPIDRLYVFSKNEIQKNPSQVKTFSGLFISYLQHCNLWNDGKTTYEFGTKSNHNHNKSQKKLLQNIPLISSRKEEHGLSIITSSGIMWDTPQGEAIEKGNLIHLILSQIRTLHDVSFAFETLKTGGIISDNDHEALKSKIIELINHEQLKAYFREDLIINNEQDIVSASGNIIRPDRLVADKAGNYTIIDFKTGVARAEHKSQIKEYSEVLLSMNLKVKEKLLVYLNEHIEVVSV